jgi:hypothetical protein
MIKVNWLAPNASLSLVGIPLIILLCRWRTICKFHNPMGSKREHQKKSIKHCCPIGSQYTLTKNTPLPFMSQPRFAFTGRTTLIAVLQRRNI